MTTHTSTKTRGVKTATILGASLGGFTLLLLSSGSALAQCSASGTLISGSTVTCSGAQTARVGQGAGVNHITMNVNDGASITVTDTNAISLGDFASVVLGSSGPVAGGSAANAPVLVHTMTTPAASIGQYLDGSNAIDLGTNTTILINRNASVVATGVQQQSEAINLYGAGNTVINYGLIQGGPSSAIFFQNVGTNAASPRNLVDNFGTIQLVPFGIVNPVTAGQAVSSLNDVGIDFINETGAKVIGNLVFQGGDDRITLNPGSTITGDFDGGGGSNLLTLNASGASADSLAGSLNNFQILNKTGSGSWTLTGAIGNNGGSTPLAVNVIGGTLVLIGNNTAFNGSVAINPGPSTATAGPDATASLTARAQSLPPLITDHGVLRFNQVSPDGVQPADGTYAGLIQGTGAVTKAGSGATVLTATNPYSGATTILAGALAVGDAAHASAALSGGGAVSVASGSSLGGYGSVSGSVSNNGTVGVASALPVFAGLANGGFQIGGGLDNRGVVNLRGAAPGNTLMVNGDYAGNGGVIRLNTLLNAGGPLADQVTDRLLIRGAATGSTVVEVNGSGPGAYTSTGTPLASDGISLIQVGGASATNTFSLAGGYVSNGTPFQYHLIAYGPGSPNGLAAPGQTLVGNAAGHWDYRLQSINVTPAGSVPPVTPVTPSTPATPSTLVTPSTPATPAAPVTPATPASVVTPQPTMVVQADPDVAVPAKAPANDSASSTAAATTAVPGRAQLAPQVPSYITAPTALFNAGIQDIDSLHRRLGDIRTDRDPGQSEVFARAYGNRSTYVSNRSFNDYGFNSTQDYGALQVGGNRVIVDNADGSLRLGGALSAGRLSFQPRAIDGKSTGLFNIESLAGVITWQSRAGWYVDTIISGGVFDGRVSTAARGQAGSLNGTSWAASMEVGYPIATGWRGVTIEPQAQLIYQNLDVRRATDVDGIAVGGSALSQGVVRGGLRLTKAIAGANGAVFTPYLKADVLTGLSGGDAIQIGGLPFATGRYGTTVQFGGGVTGELSSRLHIFGDVARQENIGAGSRGWTLNGGVRLMF